MQAGQHLMIRRNVLLNGTMKMDNQKIQNNQNIPNNQKIQKIQNTPK